MRTSIDIRGNGIEGGGGGDHKLWLTLWEK